jgi:hypothetical protein
MHPCRQNLPGTGKKAGFWQELPAYKIDELGTSVACLRLKDGSRLSAVRKQPMSGCDVTLCFPQKGRLH